MTLWLPDGQVGEWYKKAESSPGIVMGLRMCNGAV